MKTIGTIKTETRSIAELIPFARNSRTHSDEQIAQIAASIREFGWTNPILVDGENGIIAGHGRLAAARKLGLADVPVIVIDHLTDAQKRALVIADNKLALNAGWDMDLLSSELAGLGEEGFDLSLLGFNEDELAKLLEPEAVDGLTDEDAVPEPPKKAITKPGDIITLGRHRLMCGDSTKAEDVDALMGGRAAALCLTDPPYGLGDTASTKNEYSTYQDTKENLKKLIDNFLPLAQSIAPVVVLTPGTTNHRMYPAPKWTMAWFTPAGTGVGPWGFCCWQPILCYGKDPKMSKGLGSHPDAIVHTEAAEKFGHPCTKPIRFWEWLMERTSEVGELIYEPFSGSGTTFIAAEKTGRICYGMELDPIYCDVIVKRWQDFTGQEAIHEATGKTFAEMADIKNPLCPVEQDAT